ncbi:hypothetical protein [Nostoc sp. PA-18-2419]|uniref:hypothetical protein n=1 Tax=Nostoc sp. PA-18-2419 TaxID=2575443 RepID=UPI001109EA12|nr:hypothetical protein [Nostoc sp. PA-18-2419]
MIHKLILKISNTENTDATITGIVDSIIKGIEIITIKDFIIPKIFIIGDSITIDTEITIKEFISRYTIII